MQQEAEARQQELALAASSQAAAEAIEQQLEQALTAGQADLAAVISEKQELQSRLGLKQQQCSELQQQLEAEQGRSAEGRSQIVSLEEALAESNAAVKAKGQALDSVQEQIKQLQQSQLQKEDALACACAKHEQLTKDLAAAHESSKIKQDEVMKQVTELHQQLSAAQQDQDRLHEELDAARTDNSALQAQLADAQGETDSFRVRIAACAGTVHCPTHKSLHMQCISLLFYGWRCQQHSDSLGGRSFVVICVLAVGILMRLSGKQTSLCHCVDNI